MPEGETINNNEVINSSEKQESISEQNGVEEKKESTKDNKIIKIVIIVLIGVLVLTGGIILLCNLLDSGGLAWDEEYGDYKLDYISQTTMELGLKVDNDDILEKVAIDGDCSVTKPESEIERNNLKLNWNLSDAAGECKVTVKYKLKTLEKKFSIIPNKVAETASLNIEDPFKLDEKSDEDIDGDGLSNKEEKKNDTKPLISDTDGDGLLDGEEVNDYKTNPLKADSDGDGLNDYNEVVLGYDPLKKDSKGDGKKDGERELKYEYANDYGVKVTISGKGNIASIGADIIKDAALSRRAGMVNKLYNFHTDGKLSEAIVTIPYTMEELSVAGITEDELKLGYYDEKDGKYKVIDTVVDKNAKTITAKLDHFSYYVVMSDKYGDYDKKESEILFILDNSWSMYTNEQYKKITGEDYVGGFLESDDLPGSDEDGRRFSLTAELAEKLSKRGAKIGLAEFRYDYALIKKTGSKIESIKEKLNGMNGTFVTATPGTNIGGAIRGGAKDFSEDAKDKTIVILTDGQDTVNLYSQANDIAKEMKEDNVRVCAIGFGEGTYNDYLSMIATMTGCNYFSSSDVSGLDEVFNRIETQLNDELVDIDGDGKNDGILVADSGFVVGRDGFSFSNYGSNKAGGHCYGMATFAQLYYSGKMPLKASAKKNSKGDESYSYSIYSNELRKYQNLYDYKLKTNDLKYIDNIGFSYFDEETPSNYRTLNLDTLSFGSKARSAIEQVGIYNIVETESTLSSDQQIAKYGFSYKKYEDVELDEDKMQSNSNISYDDRNLLNAILAGHIRQHDVKDYFSGSSPLIWIRTEIIKKEVRFMTDGSGFIQLLAQRLNAGEALLVSLGFHAVNAISLVQDSKDSSLYYINIYDNNYPGEVHRIDLKCNKNSCETKKNDYFDGGIVLRATISQEEDLKWFE